MIQDFQSYYYGKFLSNIRKMTNGDPALESVELIDRCQLEAEEETKRLYAEIPAGFFHNHRLSLHGTSWLPKRANA